jgi:hypothetical protein
VVVTVPAEGLGWGCAGVCPLRHRSSAMWSTGIDRIDASGRVADRAIAAALGWRGGDRLTLTAEAGVVVVCRDPAGMVTLPASQYIVIPATLRREDSRPADAKVISA